jgi:hypothetical protein
MMDCKHINELLVEYLYQELDPSQVESFEAHLQSCPRCAQELASYERTRAIVQEMPEVEPPPRIDERILAEAARLAQGRPSSPTQEPGFWQRIVEGLRMLVMHPAMTAAVTLVLVLGVSFYVYRSSSPKSVREELDTPYSPEVDRRLPSGSATISVRERAATEQEKRLEGEKDRVGTQVQAPLRARQEERGFGNGLAKAEPRAKRAVTRRAKGETTEDEPGLRPGGRRGPAETANVFGKAGTGQGGSVSPTPAAAAPAADPMATIGKGGKLAKHAKAPMAPKADEAPTRASKTRDRESADKNQYAQKKTIDDILDGALLGKGGGKTSTAKSTPRTTAAKDAPRAKPAPIALKRAVAPRKEAPRAKPAPIAAEARPAKSRGKGWSGKGSSMNDDLDSVGDESKAAYKGQLASKLKAPTSALAARAVEDGDKARSAGRCDQALAHYNRAISLDRKQLPMLAGKVRACAAELAKVSDLPLFKAAKSYPALAGLLAPELERARARRTERASKEVQQTQVRGPRKAAKAKAAKQPTKVDAYESAK